jgi:thymidylate kinase
MFSVALIGPDGAGKSTIARCLEQQFPFPVKTLYMGINLTSSNVALPTSRVIEKLKRIRTIKSHVSPSDELSTHARSSKHRGVIWASLRLLNRLAEEWYRQLLSWGYRRRGQIVIYDRHFKFDFEYEPGAKGYHFADWLHRWCLARLYPLPDLVIFLDAPAETLFARKGEGSLEWLEARRQAFLRQGSKTPNFVRVDAAQPPARVYAEVAEHIWTTLTHKLDRIGEPSTTHASPAPPPLTSEPQ